MQSSSLIVGAIILWIVPIFVANSQGNAKNRAGFFYGLLLGWIGVLILAVLPSRAPTPSPSPTGAKARLLELTELRDSGDITPVEYDERRVSILHDV